METSNSKPDDNKHDDGKKISRDAYTQAAAIIVAAKIRASGPSGLAFSQEDIANEFASALAALRLGNKKGNAQRKAMRAQKQGAAGGQ